MSSKKEREENKRHRRAEVRDFIMIGSVLAAVFCMFLSQSVETSTAEEVLQRIENPKDDVRASYWTTIGDGCIKITFKAETIEELTTLIMDSQKLYPEELDCEGD